MEQLLMSAYEAMSRLGYDLSKFGSKEAFGELVEEIDFEASGLKSGPVLFAAVAVDVYSDGLMDYVSPPDAYNAAAVAIEMDAQDADWGRIVRRRRYIDKIAEILELMILDLDPDAQEDD